MRPDRSAAVWLGVLLALHSAHARAQEPEAVGPSLLDTAEAVLEWYARHPAPPFGSDATVVLSPMTVNYELGANGYTRVRIERISLHATTAWARRLSARLGRPVRLCETFDRDRGLLGLCGIEHPWTWILIAPPTVVDGQLVVVVELRALSLGPGGQYARGVVDRIFLLERDGPGWRVEERGGAGSTAAGRSSGPRRTTPPQVPAYHS